VADHVHVQDTVLVELVDDSFGWDADGGYEKLSTGVDDYIDKLVQLALCVVIAAMESVFHVGICLIATYLVLRALPPT